MLQQTDIRGHDGLSHIAPTSMNQNTAAPNRPFMELSWTDRLLTPAILLSMITGVIIGEFVPGVQHAFDLAQFRGVSARTYNRFVSLLRRPLTGWTAIAVGLIVMMWPILTKVH